MKKIFIIIFSILFLFSNSNAETFNAALKKAYDTNPEHLEPDLWSNSIEALKITTYRRRAAMEDLVESP